MSFNKSFLNHTIFFFLQIINLEGKAIEKMTRISPVDIVKHPENITN